MGHSSCRALKINNEAKVISNLTGCDKILFKLKLVLRLVEVVCAEIRAGHKKGRTVVSARPVKSIL